jgi:hypothetical protein
MAIVAACRQLDASAAEDAGQVPGVTPGVTIVIRAPVEPRDITPPAKVIDLGE